MKKILLNFVQLFSVSLTFNAVSCFEAGNDPYEYLPSKIYGYYDNLLTPNNYITFVNDKDIANDYSTLITSALQSFGSDKFEREKYEHLRYQFVDEISYYSKFAEAITFKYAESTLINAEPLIIEDKKILQIIRVINFDATPTITKDKIVFTDIMLEKYIFNYTDDTKGQYEKTNKIKSIQTITIDKVDFIKFDENKKEITF